jgi:hypothetical protein
LGGTAGEPQAVFLEIETFWDIKKLKKSVDYGTGIWIY